MNPEIVSIFIKMRSSLLCLVLFGYSLTAQPLPIGTWSSHFNYFEAKSLTGNSEFIFCMTANGLFTYDLLTGEINLLNHEDGLSSNNFSAISWINNELYIGYSSGKIEIYDGRNVRTLSFIEQLALNIDKTIRRFDQIGDDLYISTGFGVIAFSLSSELVRESYTDLGNTSLDLGFNQVYQFGDSIYFASDDGLLSAPFTGLVNLQNPANYNRSLTGQVITALTGMDNTLWVGSSENAWAKMTNGYTPVFGQTTPIHDLLNRNGELIIASDNGLFRWNNALEPINTTLEVKPNALYGQNELFVADQLNGLLAIQQNQASILKPDGPIITIPTRIIQQGNKTIVLEGVLRRNTTLEEFPGRISIFEEGEWVNYSAVQVENTTSIPAISNIISARIYQDRLVFSSFMSGLFWETDTGFTRLNEPHLINDEERFYSDLYADDTQLLLSEYGTDSSFHVWNGEGWYSFRFSTSTAQFPVELIPASSGLIWLRQDPFAGKGIHVFDIENNRSLFISDATNSGGLPSNLVNDFHQDQDGEFWCATGEGLAYFSPIPAITDNTSVDAITPILDERPLLRDQQITCITSDGGSRKWIGTTRGLWLVSANGDQVFGFFDEKNSPLTSGNIVDLAFNALSGELFIATEAGLQSLRTNSVAGNAEHAPSVKIYPNPVPPGYAGQVGLEGLARNATVKITDLSGKLVYETSAFGGRTSWNLLIPGGGRAPQGLYLVFSSTENGEDTLVGKIAVVN